MKESLSSLAQQISAKLEHVVMTEEQKNMKETFLRLAEELSAELENAVLTEQEKKLVDERLEIMRAMANQCNENDRDS